MKVRGFKSGCNFTRECKHKATGIKLCCSYTKAGEKCEKQARVTLNQTDAPITAQQKVHGIFSDSVPQTVCLHGIIIMIADQTCHFL